MKRLLLLAIFFVSTAAAAQTPPTSLTPPPQPMPATSPIPPAPADELAQNLFTPDLVLKFRQDIGLDDAQSKSLKELVQNAQRRFLDLQWDMQAEAGKLGQLLRASRIDETAAIAQADKVLGMEREVKKAQLSLLVRIKNLLTPAQQDKLAELRRKNS
jgi:Spy/CpxP family protein refolding chaperone